jgi:predicted nucleotidyltransferase
MTREEIIEKLRAMEPELRARGITRLQMFGSRARGDNREDSDLDLLIEVDPSRNLSLFEITGMHLDLTETLGIPTYLIEGEGLKSRFRRRIDDDLVPVFN